MNIQAPPNLSAGALRQLVAAGINDWGGVSPVTPDYVNPERPWPHLDALARETAKAGKVLGRAARHLSGLCAPRRYLARPSAANGRSCALPTARALLAPIAGLRERSTSRPPNHRSPLVHDAKLDAIVAGRSAGQTLTEDDIVTLFASRGDAFHVVCEAADALRARSAATRSATSSPATSTTPISVISAASFAPFQRANSAKICAGRPYDLDLEEIQRA